MSGACSCSRAVRAFAVLCASLSNRPLPDGPAQLFVADRPRLSVSRLITASRARLAGPRVRSAIGTGRCGWRAANAAPACQAPRKARCARRCGQR